jgi:hypothetical protein
VATPPPARDRLEPRRAEPERGAPRMDVAAFVGFAATGPLHVPTRVESFACFEAIFGGDVELPSDPARGEAVRAQLRLTVRAFFDHGGERCWVVRVARPAPPNEFPIPGVIALAPGASSGRAAFARARSQGRWSDGLVVGAALQAFPLGVTGWSPDEGWLALTSVGGRELEPWDLIRLRFDGTSLEAMMFVGVLQHGDPPGGAAPGDAATRARADAGGLIWLSPEPPGAALAGARAFDLPPPGLPLLPGAAWEAGGARVPLAMRLGDAPAPGSVIALDLEGGGEPAWLTVDRVYPDPGDRGRIWLAGPIRRRVAAPAVPPAAPLAAERLTLELWARTAVGQLVHAGLLGFHPRHRRAWMALATDEEIHGGDPPAPVPVDGAPPGQVAAPPRRGLAPATFPLAGTERGRATLPVGVLTMPTVFLGAAPPAAPAPPLERDGLAVYDEGLFVDPALAGAPAETLRAAVARRGAPGPAPGPAPRPPRGMHALLAIDEVTLIAIPDAVHAGWPRAEPAPPPARACANATPGWRVGIAVHRALLRLCAARGDVLAVLCLPRDTREDDALRHAGELRGLPARGEAPATEPLAVSPLAVPPLAPAERSVASYGALYHPWLLVPAEAGAPPVAIPPAGAVIGALASRARRAGAWVTLAGQPLAGLAGLLPVRADRHADLDAAAVNVLLGEPCGHIARSEWTLSTGGGPREIHVRRLLALLKRVVLRLGERHALEPRDSSFRRAVERGVNELLGRMFHSGAFAGATPAQAYEVRAGEAQDAPGAAERGRIVVELRVAPTHLLERFRLRLVQRRDGTLTVEED